MTKTSTSCGCVTTDFANVKILKGTSGILPVTIHLEGKRGGLKESVSVWESDHVTPLKPETNKNEPYVVTWQAKGHPPDRKMLHLLIK